MGTDYRNSKRAECIDTGGFLTCQQHHERIDKRWVHREFKLSAKPTPIPGGGGTHGLECDPFEEDTIWLTTLKSQTLSKVRISDWSVQHVIPLPYQRGHSVVRVSDGVWVVHTADRLIAKLDIETGEVLHELVVSESDPQPHELSIFGDDLVYCDATSGWIVKVVL